MSIAVYITELFQRNIRISLENGKLKVDAPKGAITTEIKQELMSKKQALIDYWQEQQNISQLPALTAVDRSQRDLPMSSAQQRLWFLQQLEPESSQYNVNALLALKGNVNTVLLRQAFADLVIDHEIFYTAFAEKMGRADVQLLSPELVADAVKIDEINLQHCDQNIEHKDYQDAIKQAMSAPFNLAEPPLFRLIQLKMSDSLSHLVLSFHHIVIDHWSLQLLTKLLLQKYKAVQKCQNNVDSLGCDKGVTQPKTVLQYLDYAHWHNQLLAGDHYQKLKDYWLQTLGTEDYCLSLTTDHPRTLDTGHQGARYSITLEHETFTALKETSLALGCTPNTILLAAYQWLLARHSGMTDIRVACPVAERGHADLEHMLGLFVNTMVVRAELCSGMTVSAWLAVVHKSISGAQKHAAMPFEKLVDELSDSREGEHEPLVQTMFNYLAVDAAESVMIDDMRVTALAIPEFQAKFDLSLFVVNDGQGINLSFQYKTQLFESSTIARLAEQYISGLKYLLSAQDKPLANHSALSAQEWQQQQQWNATNTAFDTPATLTDALIAQQQATPSNIALRYQSLSWTYQELGDRVNQLANWLVEQGCQPEDKVAICMTRSPQMVVSILATVTAGCAYLPLDPEHPQQRIDYILDHAKPCVILAMPEFKQGLSESNQSHNLWVLDDSFSLIASQSTAFKASSNVSSQLAYVLYTSGSTGQPKGVAVPHSGVMNRIAWMQAEYGLSADDIVLQKTPYSFDVSVWEFFWPLMTGSTLVLAGAGEHKDSQRLIELINEYKVTTLHFVPAMLQVFLDNPDANSCVSLSRIFCSGEALPYQLQQQCLSSLTAELHNLYGPTEASIDVTYWDCRKQHIKDVVPIGFPIANIQTWILDSELNPVPVGVSGELYLAGIGLARGYLNRPDLTAEAFIPNPFAESGAIGDAQYSRLYCTGDVARYRHDGSIEYVGRADFQVKIRGLRIELGEIEARIAELDAVKEVVVMARKEEQSATYLAAYVVASDRKALPELDEWQTLLSASLPEYMIPTVFVALDEMPLSQNGKVDRKALPQPDLAALNSSDYIAPTSSNESILVDIWQSLLNIKQVGINDNFFAIGGDSIISLQVVARAREAGLTLQPKDIFRHQTVKALSAVATQEAQVSYNQDDVYGDIPLTAIQDWYLAQPLHNPNQFNQAILLASNNDIVPEYLQQALTHLVLSHPMLAARFMESKNKQGQAWTQNTSIDDEMTIAFNVIDFSDCGSVQKQAEITKLCQREQTQLQLQTGAVFRASLLRFGSLQDGRTDYRLLLVAHHLVIDGVSWRIILDQLSHDYQRLERGGKLADIVYQTTPFKRWAEQGLLQSIDAEGVALWHAWVSNTMNRQAIKSQLPLDRIVNSFQPGEQANQRFSLSLAHSERLLREAGQPLRARIDELCLAALSKTLTEWTTNPNHLINLEGHGRDLLDMDVSQTVGWFTRLYPAVLSAEPNSWREQILQTRRQLSALPEQIVPFSLAQPLLTTQVKPQIVFNYLGQLDTQQGFMQKAPEQLSEFRDLANPLAWLLEVNVFMQAGLLKVNLQYAQQAFLPETIEYLAQAYQSHLEHMLNELCGVNQVSNNLQCLPGAIAADFPLANITDIQAQTLVEKYSNQVVEDLYPLTPVQQGMLFHCLDHSDAYISQSIVKCEGELNTSVFAQAWQAVVDNHPALRTELVIDGVDEPHQVVLKQADLSVVEYDWQGLSVERKAEALAELRNTELAAIELDIAPLMRVALICHAKDDFQLVWTIHHLIMDGWCLNLLVSEVMQGYALLSNKEPNQKSNPESNPLQKIEPAVPFSDFMVWLQKRDETAAEDYWRQQLAGIEQPNRLPAAYVQPVSNTCLPEECYSISHHMIGEDKSRQLDALCQHHALTLNTMIQGLWGMVLSRYMGSLDIVYGVTTSGRPADLPGADKILGVFINTLPLRLKLDTERKLGDWLTDIQTENLTMRDFEQTPLAKIHRVTSVPQEMSLFESLLVFENLPASDNKPQEGLSLALEEHHVRNNFPLTLRVVPKTELQFDLLIDRERVDLALATQMVTSLIQLIEMVLTEKNALDKSLNAHLTGLVSGLTVVNLPDAPVGTLLERIRCQPAEIPALLFSQDDSQLSMSYQQLIAQAGLLASKLPELNNKEAVIAICLPRQQEQIIAMLAAWWKGAAWLCIDAELPVERIKYMLEDAGVDYVLGIEQPEYWQQLSTPWFDVSSAALIQTTGAVASIIPATPLNMSDTAYVIYTSGSTGQPKGVAVSHGNALSYIDAFFARIDIASDASMTTLATVSADLGLTSVLGALATGRALMLIPAELNFNPPELAEYLARYPVDVLKIVPSHLKAMLAVDEPERLLPRQCLISGGESLTEELVTWLSKQAPKMTIVNHYGPTEATIGCIAKVIKNEEPVLLGKPLSNSTAMVVDGHGIPVAQGVAGELWLAGHGIAKGYLNKPEQTAISFVNIPLMPELGQEGEEVGSIRVYKTGDKVYQTQEGELVYLGRMDDQVKIRGYRVELNEVSAQLLDIDMLVDAIAVVVPGPSGNRLAACIVLNEVMQGGLSDSALLDKIKHQLSSMLPDYMVPTLWHVAKSLPLNRNGKVDRQQVIALLNTPVKAELSQVKAVVEESKSTSDVMTELWQGLLGCEIALNDNLFSLGADSIVCLQFIAKARKHQFKFTPKQIFNAPTVSELSLLADKMIAKVVIESKESITVNIPVKAEINQVTMVVEDAKSTSDIMTELWQGLLGCEVGLNDNLFSLGADSIVCLQFIAKARKHQFKFTPKQIFNAPTVSELSLLAEKMMTKVVVEPKESITVDSVVPVSLPIESDLLPIQHWFFEVEQPVMHHWNQAVMLKLPEQVDHSAMAQAIDAIVTKHPALAARFTFDEKHRQYRQLDSGETAGIYAAFDNQQLANIDSLVQACQQSLNLTSGPLFKVVTFNLQDGSARLLLIAHHLVVDGVSWRIIGHDLQRAYQAYLSGEYIELGSEHMSMAEWQRSLTHYPKDKLDLARQFWLPMAARSLDGILIPGAQNGTIAESEKIEQIFSTSLTQSLIEMGIIEQRSGCEVAMLTALSTTLCEVFNKDKVMIELEGHGRYPWLEDQDLSESVGWFTTRYPVSFNAESCSLSAVGKSLSQVPDQGLGYGVLRYLQQEFAFEHPQLVFNFLGQVGTNSSEWQLVSNGSGQSRHPSSIRRQLIDVTAQIRDGQLQISWQFPGVLNNKLAGLVKLFEEKLSNLIAPTLNPHYALTPMQQGMFLHSSSSSESLYFNQTVVELNGELDTSAFIQAWLQTVNAEQALKAVFEETSNGEPVQWFAKDAELPVHRYNWLGLDKREQQQRLDALCIEDRAQGFNLAQPPLMRLHLIHIAEGQYWLIWSRHHLIVDAWCSSLVIKDVLHRYLNLTGQVLSTPPVRPQFELYLNWLARQDMTQSHQFWRDQLADFNTPLVLAKGNQDDGFYLDDYKLSASLTQNIKDMSKREGVTLNAVIQSAWALTLARHSGKHDVVFGMTSSGRPADLEQAQQIIGIFINTLPVRVNLIETMTVPQLLQNTHQQGAELREHEYTPLVDIHAQSELSAGQSLFDTLLVFENEAMSESSEISQHLSVRPLSGYERNSIPLTITIMPDQQLVFRVGCNGDKLSYIASKHMLASLESILTQMVEAESQPLGLLLGAEGASASNEFVGESQKQWADNWCLEKQILNVAKYSPDAIAICDQDCELTYTQLISRVTHLAQALSERGIGVNSSVAICQQRNTELLVSLLAVLWSGAAYIPLDPNQPSARLALILAQAEPDIILVDEQAIELSTGSVQTTLASLLQNCTKDESWLDAQPLPHPEQLAYTIFTSGSTGIPKGVQISRRAFANFLQSMMEITGLSAKDKLLAVTTLGFDIAGLELFLPLLVGGQVVMASYDASRDGQQLAELIKQQCITVMQATPITWQMLTEQASLNWSNLTVITGGEALQPSLAQSIVAKGARLFNVYGPTETTVWSSAVALNKHSAAQPHLGSPIANTDFYVLDDWFNPVVNGVEGELFIGGEGLARGYTNQPSLTAEVFMPDPFSTIAGARMYQTGDVVCINNQGNMEFIGRKDFQMKLRGYRIEAGEIEAILNAYPGVKDAVIQLCYVDTPHACLVGYVTAIQSMHLDIGSLMAQLRDALPSYMVPQSIVVLEAMPLNANNKIDRKALPNPEQSTKVGLPPSSEMELWLASTWGSLLGGGSVFAADDFFVLGGNSLLAGRMIALLKQQKNINLNLTLLFRYPVLRDLAAAIMQVDKSELISASSLVVALKQGVNDDGQQQSPLFIFHPAGGHVQAYAELVASLPPENTVYGIQSPQLLDLSLVPDSVDEFAKLYVKALQSVQPKGPYRLLGWSFGAWLAIAVTNQLEASGQTVEWLGIVDARADAHRAKLNLPAFPIVARYLACLDNETRELLLDKYRLELGSLEADLQQVQTEERDDIAFEYLSDLLAIHKPLINRDSGASEMHYMQMKLFMKCHLLMQSHRLQPVSVPMAVWWATGTLTDREYQLGAKENEWQDYGSVSISILTGDHQSIIRDPLLTNEIANSLGVIS